MSLIYVPRVVTVNNGNGDPGELHKLQGDLTPITMPVCWALAMDNGEGVQPPESRLLGMRGALPYNGGPR
jgi:hypothetical protein